MTHASIHCESSTTWKCTIDNLIGIELHVVNLVYLYAVVITDKYECK